MRTRTRFALLFAAIGLAVMAVGVVAIYEAVGRDAERRIPADAEALLGAAVKRAMNAGADSGADPAIRLEDATQSLIAARALLAERRVMGKDAVVGLALEVAAILGAVLASAALAFYFLSRFITRGLDELAALAVIAQGDKTRRFTRSSDPDLDAVARSLNELLDLAAEQERRLGAAAKLEGWREVASFLAHQLKNPLAAVLLAAENLRLALRADAPRDGTARESLEIVRIEAARLRALIDRFRDLAPAGLDAYGSRGEFELRPLLEDCAARAERSGATVAIVGDPSRIRVAGDPSRIKVAGDPSKIWVAADKGLIEQALWNLFANSIEAAAENGSSVSIEALIESGSNQVFVTILDSNRGIDADIVPRLGIERLSTKSSGTGLGLILVRRIFAAQGGSLELFATREGGLGARVALPLASVAREAT